MCSEFAQMASWRDVETFSQPLVITGAPEEIATSTPRRFANIWKSEILSADGASRLSSGIRLR